MELFDAVIAGAGPAGSTLARTLARKGLRVLLVEKETPGSRRVCGGFAGPEITDFFSSTGLASRFEAFPKNAVHQVRVSSAYTGVMDTAFPQGPGWSVDRSLFDAWLAQEAVLEGTDLLTHSTVTSAHKMAGIWGIRIEGDHGQRRVRSRFYLVTTGRRAPKPSADPKIFFACKTVYENTLIPQDRVTLHFVEKGHVGLNPLGNGRTAMCLYVESSRLRSYKGDLDEMMEGLKGMNSALKEDMRGARRAADWQTCAAEPDHKRFFYRNGIFFAGDALTMVNPIVGGGMSIATASAHILGELVTQAIRLRWTDEQLASAYKRSWNTRFEKRVNLAASLGMVERSKILSNSLLFLMGSVPAVFSRLVHKTRKDPLVPAAGKLNAA